MENEFCNSFDSENDYMEEEHSFEYHFNLVFGKIQWESQNNANQNLNNHSKKENMNENNKNFIEAKEPKNVISKSSIPIFSVYKDEDYVIFKPAYKMKYLEKYFSKNLIFKEWKDEKSRKEKPDEIRKKIKSRFFKSLKECINQNFPTEKKLEFLPQSFISNISFKENNIMLGKTLEEIILNNKEENSKKYENNINLLKYLKDNKDNNKIKKNYIAFNTPIEKIFQEYLVSEEFDKSIAKLEEEGNYSQYIKNYINQAKNFNEYFSCYKNENN